MSFLTKLFTFLITAFALGTWPTAIGFIGPETNRNWGITEQTISDAISPYLLSRNLPERIDIPNQIVDEPLTVNYTFDQNLQDHAEYLLEKYNPDYGVFVAINPDNGNVLAMAESRRDGLKEELFALKNTFPGASIYKIVTALAAVNEGVASENTIIPFNGKGTSFYKKNVFDHKDGKWTRKYTLNESFAKSVNSVFGRLGAVYLKADTMLEYADKLGFNQRFSSDFAFESGTVNTNPDDSWQIAELASGYTRENTLSPMHGAVLGALAINQGYLVNPVIVQSLTDSSGIPIYYHEKPNKSSVIHTKTAEQLKSMMQSTIQIGSAKRSFGKLSGDSFKGMTVGGKTGSLTGTDPKGRYDWFVGFAHKEDRKIAYAMLCINKEKWYIKSARFVREILKYYYRPPNQNT
ncbi:MAG: penicillin-binding transpeptidase domain-containing protein [Gammaproteobacteria bacterium]|nr:penicillin-binding transpeptidase domain-containing protein [Gammaproteobacteria bacterium]